MKISVAVSLKALGFIHFSSLMQHKSLHRSLPGCVGLGQVTTQESSEPSEAWAWSSGTCSFQPCSAISTLLWQNECPGWCSLQGAQGLCDRHRAPPWARSQYSRLQGTFAGFYGKCLSLSSHPLVCGSDAEPHEAPCSLILNGSHSCSHIF